MRKRNNPLTDIPIGLCIVFIVMGLLLGTLFSFGKWRLNILSFEDSAAFIKRDNIYFSAILGTLCYIMAFIGILSLIFHYIEWKRFYYLKYKKY